VIGLEHKRLGAVAASEDACGPVRELSSSPKILFENFLRNPEDFKARPD
jgi:hypothetical protein